MSQEDKCAICNCGVQIKANFITGRVGICKDCISIYFHELYIPEKNEEDVSSQAEMEDCAEVQGVYFPSSTDCLDRTQRIYNRKYEYKYTCACCKNETKSTFDPYKSSAICKTCVRANAGTLEEVHKISLEAMLAHAVGNGAFLTHYEWPPQKADQVMSKKFKYTCICCKETVDSVFSNDYAGGICKACITANEGVLIEYGYSLKQMHERCDANGVYLTTSTVWPHLKKAAQVINKNFIHKCACVCCKESFDTVFAPDTNSDVICKSCITANETKLTEYGFDPEGMRKCCDTNGMYITSYRSWPHLKSAIPDLKKVVATVMSDADKLRMKQKGNKVMKSDDVSDVSVNPFLDMMKEDMTKAGYRVAAMQMTKGAKAGLLLALKDKGMESVQVQTISAMLDSEPGSAIVSMMLGMMLTYMPGLKDDPRVEMLASEFRVNGAATAGNLVVDAAMEYVMPSVKQAMAALPPLTELDKKKMRVKEEASVHRLPVKDEEEIPESEETVPVRRSRASAKG